MKQVHQIQRKGDINQSEATAIKLPFLIQTVEEVYKFINEKQFDKISKGVDNIQLQSNKIVNLSKKKLSRPLYQVKIVQYRDKITGEKIQKIEQSLQVNKNYDFTKMCDFYISNPEPEFDLDQMKQSLKNKILLNQFVNTFKFTAKPHSFLKSFNLSLPNNDLLVNKSESMTKKQVKSKQIIFGESLPVRPDFTPNYITNIKIFPIVSQYFRKRPCWLRNVLQYQLRLDGFKGAYSTNQLKNVLKFLSYTFKDGPWKHVFCRFEYDPTKHNEAVLYQTLMVKIKKKQVQDYESKQQNFQQQSDVYDPTFNQIPTKFLRIYQLCDIEEGKIQQLLKEVCVSGTQCNKQTGWFSKNQYSQLQRIIRSIRQRKSKN